MNEYLKIHEYPIFPVFYGYCDRKMMEVGPPSFLRCGPSSESSESCTTASYEAEISRNTRPGKHTKNYGKSPFFMGKSTINGDFP